MDRRASQRERRLASRLLAFEVGQETGLQRRVEALARAFDKLYQSLVGIVGPAGNLALAERALHLAVRECPCLGSVRPVLRGNLLYLDGLLLSMMGSSDQEVGRAAVALLGNLLWLISSLLGYDLSLRLIKSAWPALDESAWLPEAPNDGG